MTQAAIAFMESGDFAYILRTQSVAAVPGTVNVQVCSRWLGARHPQEEQRKLNVTLSRTDLGRLISGLQAAFEQDGVGSRPRP